MRKSTDYLIVHIPSFVIALLIAETFFKFHSFTLELLAFLPTWYVFFVGIRGLLRLFANNQTSDKQN